MRYSANKTKSTVLGWSFLIPLVLYVTIFLILPIIISFFYSLTDWNGISDSYTFVGIQNYIQVLTNRILYPDFWKSIWTTVKYALFSIPLSVALTLLVASILNSKIKGERFFKTCFYIPSVTAGVAISAIWIFLLDPTYGVVGFFNSTFGWELNILGSEKTALPALALISVWGGLGYNVLILLSSMKNINPQLYEACEIDGGGTISKFFNVTLPSVLPTLFFLITTSTIGAFQTFDQMYLMTGGGKGTTTIMFEVYKLYMNEYEVGTACAMSYILFLVIAFVLAIQFKLLPQSGGSSVFTRKERYAKRCMRELQHEETL